MQSIKLMSFTLILVLSSTLVRANEIKDAVKNGTLVLINATCCDGKTDYWADGVAVSNYQVTDVEVIPGWPGSPENGMIYLLTKVGSRNFKVAIKHKGVEHIFLEFQWAEQYYHMITVPQIRRFMNFLDEQIRAYIELADENNKISKTASKEYNHKKLNEWADNIKSQTFYLPTEKTKSTATKKWDSKKYGKIRRVSSNTLNNTVESGENPNGYYVYSTKRISFFWMTGFITLGTGFVIAPTIPKYRIHVFSTDNDRFIGTFLGYNPYKKPQRMVKRIKKYQTVSK